MSCREVMTTPEFVKPPGGKQCVSLKAKQCVRTHLCSSEIACKNASMFERNRALERIHVRPKERFRTQLYMYLSRSFKTVKCGIR